MNRFIAIAAIAASFAASSVGNCQNKPSTDTLIEGFMNPPPSARMRMFWRVFGPAWQPGEIDYQFDLMKAAGIGGVMTSFFYPVALDNESGNVHNQTLGSEEFLTTFGYAARQAKEKGLKFSVFGGSGWPFGGPTVTPKDAAQRIRRVIVHRDSDSSWTLPKLTESEKYVAAFNGKVNILGARKSGDLTSGMKVSAGTSRGDLQVFIAGPTGMKVKRPALGGEGLVVDHYSRPAALRYLDTVVSPMLRAAPGLLDTVFCDSLEVYNANWTHDFPEQFKKRRGYDIVAKLPALFDDKNAECPDLRFDFWRTLAELTEERFTKTTGEWARSHGTKLEMEAYGTPPNPLTAARYIDVPGGEQYEWQGFSMSRLAASGAHLAGRRIISAEAWTWLGIPNRLADSLQDMKLASDIHFLAGCNDLIGVDFPYSPRSVPAPGWQPYYGPTMNQNNPQWPYFHALVEYVNRCQWMLRQGKPQADIAIYLPVEDSFAHGPVEQMLLDFHLRDRLVSGEKTGEFGLTTSMKHRSDLIQMLITNGYDFDGIDFWSINRFSKIKDHKLVCGDGEYSIVILPDLEGINAEALEKLDEFVKQGGALVSVGRLPEKGYGLTRHAPDARVRAAIQRLFGTKGSLKETVARRYGQGDVFAFTGIEPGTDEMAPPLIDAVSDFKSRQYLLRPPQPQVSVAHRRTSDWDLYFLVNLGDAPAEFEAVMGTPPHFKCALLDPQTGKVYLPENSQQESSPLGIRMQAHQSLFVICTEAEYHGATGRITPEVNAAVKLSELWNVVFEGPDAPTPRVVRDLESWTKWQDARYFSGQAIYTSTFEWNAGIPKHCRMRFDSVHEAGEVWINGKSAGVVWMPPYEVEVGHLLRHGTNTIKVTVGNVPANRFIGLPDEDLKPLRAKYGNRFPDPQEKRVMREPALSGLIGNVWLVYNKDLE